MTAWCCSTLTRPRPSVICVRAARLVARVIVLPVVRPLLMPLLRPILLEHAATIESIDSGALEATIAMIALEYLGPAV
jgi:hypothetical protein